MDTGIKERRDYQHRKLSLRWKGHVDYAILTAGRLVANQDGIITLISRIIRVPTDARRVLDNIGEVLDLLDIEGAAQMQSKLKEITFEPASVDDLIEMLREQGYTIIEPEVQP